MQRTLAATSSRGVITPHRNVRLPSHCLMIRLGLTCSATSRYVCQRPARNRWSVVLAATTADLGQQHLEDDEVDIGLGLPEELDESELGPPPAVRHQQAMHIKDRKAWRAKAETMAKEKKLVKIQIGQLGITQSFLRACTDVLQKHTLVRVKLGEGCGLERRAAAAVLEKYLDCVCVHQIGFTVTLYRQAGLPRPSNIPGSDPVEADTDAIAAAALEASRQAEEASRARLKKKKEGQKRPSDRPPEFNVL